MSKIIRFLRLSMGENTTERSKPLILTQDKDVNG